MRSEPRAYESAFPHRLRKHIARALILVDSLPAAGAIYRHVYHARIRSNTRHGLKDMLIEGYNVCNLRCVMCPYHRMTREKTLMSMELFGKIMDDAAGSGIKMVRLHLYNEPLADPLLFERISCVKSKGMLCSFSSNGTLLNREKTESILASGLDSIYFSFDGATKEAYEKIRVGADFERTRDNIVRLIQERNRRKQSNPSVHIRFVIQKDNCKDTEAFRAFWQGLADGVGVNDVDNREKYGLRSDEIHRRPEARHLFPCSRIFRTITVTSDGKVALCCMDFDAGTELGDLNRQSIRQVYESPEWKRIRQLHMDGRGNEVGLCSRIRCPDLFGNASAWWRSQEKE